MLTIKKSTGTLSQLFEEYISECQYSKGLRPKTIDGYNAVFGHFSMMMPEVTSPQLLTVEMLNEFFKRIKSRQRTVNKTTVKVGLEDSTVKTYGAKLNAFFGWLVHRKIIFENPLSHIKLHYPEYKDKRALDSSDINKIFAAITLHSKSPLILRRDTAMISSLFFCGLRLGEFISLLVSDFDIEKRLLSVRSETSKSKKTRYVPIHPTALLNLREYLKERNRNGYKTEFLFVSSSQDKQLSRHGLKHWVKRLNNLSGVKFHLHRFRHSFACNLAKNNTNLVKIQKLMGHSDPKMTATYLRSITAEDCREDIYGLSI